MMSRNKPVAYGQFVKGSANGWKLGGSVLLALALQVLVLVLLHQPGQGKGRAAPASVTLCVNETGTGGCYDKIQEAIDAASPGDVITVAVGTYVEHVTMTKGVSVYGQGWSTTVISGAHSAPRATVRFQSGITASTVLSGVRVTAGGTGDVTSSAASNVFGGGIYIRYGSPAIINTWVDDSTARDGGGVYVEGGSPTFENVPVWNCRAERGGGFFFISGAEVTIVGNPLDPAINNWTVLWNLATIEGGGFFMHNVTATLTGLRIWGNTAAGTSFSSGGGIYVNGSPYPITLVDNVLSGNSATNHGGGIVVYDVAHLQATANWFGPQWSFGGNDAGQYGGGAFLNQSAGLVQANWFLDHTAGSGGGVFISGGGPDLVFKGNWFEDNSANSGGGLNLGSSAAPVVDANTFVTNTGNMGGAIYMYQAGVVSITNNVMAHNVANGGAGGAIAVTESPPRIVNNTIVTNSGDGIWFYLAEGIAVVNNIIADNSGDGIKHYTYPSSTLVYTVDYNDVCNDTYGGALSAGPHDLAVDPQFVASGANLAGYYHIQSTSPVSQTGSITWAPARDIDGDLRILGGGVSMGADEIPVPEYTIDLPLVIRE